MLSSPAHIPAIRVSSFRCRVRGPGRDLRGDDRDLLRERVRQTGVLGQGHDGDQLLPRGVIITAVGSRHSTAASSLWTRTSRRVLLRTGRCPAAQLSFSAARRWTI